MGSMTLVRMLVIAGIVAGSLATVPGPADGFRGHSGNSSGHKGFSSSSRKSVFPQAVDPWKFWPPRTSATPRHHHGFERHHGFDGRHFSGGFVGAPSVIVTSEALVSAPTFVSGLPAAVPAPAAFPTARLIEYETGWYQLRGDGVSSPYVWVWIPKPPPPLPAAPDPAPPLAPSASLPAEPPARADRGPAYHWADEGGVTTWTNRLDRVPKRFRDRAASTANPE